MAAISQSFVERRRNIGDTVSRWKRSPAARNEVIGFCGGGHKDILAGRRVSDPLAAWTQPMQPVNHPNEYKSFAGDPGQETGDTPYGTIAVLISLERFISFSNTRLSS